MHAAAWSQAAPAIALTKAERWDQPGRRWAAFACLINVAGDVLNYGLSQAVVNNLWVGYISTPLSSAFILLALATWQTTQTARRRLVIAIPFYLGMWAVAIYFAEDLEQYSSIAFPLHSVFLLVCCVWTLLRKALGEQELPFVKSDWLWIAGGFALMVGTAAAVEPLMGILIRRNQIDQAMSVVNFRAGLQLLALVGITVGMLCPVTTVPSGPSSSPAR